MIRVQNVCKTYPTRFGEKLVLDDVSFQLKKGEKLGILGRNGAGKSTLIRLISGAEAPTSGRIDSDMSISWPLAFGGAFQTNLTGVDNVRFISRIYSQDFDKNIKFVEDFSELGDYLREEVRTYSSGMRARLAFAISMITEFDCFLIDEVSAVGDARFHERCNRELFEKRADRAMVIISHDSSYIRKRCNRFAVLNEGKLRLYDEYEDAHSEYRHLIGLDMAQKPAPKSAASDRDQLIEAMQNAALGDEAFVLLMQEAHWKIHAKEYADAISLFFEGFEAFPYQHTYWAQLGHAAKEGGNLTLAESAYRTACALGEPNGEIESLAAPMMRQAGTDISQHPFPKYRRDKANKQAPGLPDISLFALAAWKTKEVSETLALDLLRGCPDCDTLLAAMIKDHRFEVAQADWLVHWQNGQTHALSGDAVNIGETPLSVKRWASNLAAIACPTSEGKRPGEVAERITGPDNAWSVITDAEGFLGWDKAQAALNEKRTK